MNDFQTINEIVNESVKHSSYVTIVISSCVFVLYTLIIKLFDYFKSKNKSRPLYEMAIAVKENTTNIVNLNKVLSKLFDDAEKKELSRINFIIKTSFDSFKTNILSRCIDIIVHNDIEKSKENIKQTLYKQVSIEYYKVYSSFSLYEHDSVNLAIKLKEEWIDSVTNDCLQVIYNNNDAITRIRQLNNKLTIDIDGFSIYINNKVFAH